MSSGEVTCKKCGGLYSYELVGTVYPGGKDKEEIICPFCGEVEGHRMTSQNMCITPIKAPNGTNKTN